MRIAVTAVAARKAGGSTLILEKLIDSLPRVAPEHDFRFFVSSRFAEALTGDLGLDGDTSEHKAIRLAANVDMVAIHAPSQPARLRWDQVDYPRHLKEFGADVSINALGFGPLHPGVPQCTVIQDSTYFCSMRHFQRTTAERVRTEVLRRLLLGVIKRSRRVVVPSQSLKEAISREVEPSMTARIVVIRDPFEAEYTDPASRPARRGSGNSRNPVTILYLSHLEPHKAHSLLPEIAVELMRRTSRPFRFVVAVDRNDSPRLYDALLQKIEATGTGCVFEMYPRLAVPEIPRILAGADVFLFPSLCESFGYPMAEAGAAGLPVVASDTPINREMLGKDALYFEPGRADNAAEALERLIADPRLRTECAAAIQRHQRSILPTGDEYARSLVQVVVGTVDAGK